MIKILLRGCNGKMGQEISKLVKSDEECMIVAGVDRHASNANEYPVFPSIKECNVNAHVIIDFSSPDNLDEMLNYAKDNKLPIVLCTTGLSEDDLTMVEEASKVVPVLRSANMSLGINIMIKLIQEAAKVLSSDFDIEIIEKHHNQKIDAPSGTALLLADSINEVLDEEYAYQYDRTQDRKKREKKEIGILPLRGGTIIGEHEVVFAGLDEVFEIKHTAYSRAIFAKGAVAAAKYLIGKNPGYYQMKDVISS